MNSEYAFIIPAFNPNYKLIDLIANIRSESQYRIFIIDDGSKNESIAIFDNIKLILEEKNIILLKHKVNLGKGAALKTVFNHILVKYPEIKGVVTLDSDGQHSVKDCIRVLKKLENCNSKALVLGYREFSKDIPLKSYVGNNISRMIYKMVLKKDFKDTQTGLRGLTKTFMQESLSIKANRFEFETEQLVLATKNDTEIIEIPIKTIYIENNKATSFRPLVDSFKIYFVLLRYMFSSLVSALVDITIFSIVILLGENILTANFFGRGIGLIVNFLLLQNVVFKDKEQQIKKFILFVSYVMVMGLISAMLIDTLSKDFSLNLYFSKIIVECTLFILNFAFLKTFLFRRRNM